MSAIITGLASVLQNAVNAFSTKMANKRQENLMAAQQRYYSPQMYMNRLRAAGINARIGVKGYNEPQVNAPNIQAPQIDLGGIAQAVEQFHAKRGLDLDNANKDIQRKKGNIDLGNTVDTDVQGEPIAPYAKALNNKNLIDKGIIDKQKIENKIAKFKSQYIEQTEENRLSLEAAKIRTLDQIEQIKKYDVKAAEDAMQRLQKFGIYIDDTEIEQLLKMGSVKAYGKKLDNLGEGLWDSLIKILGL